MPKLDLEPLDLEPIEESKASPAKLDLEPVEQAAPEPQDSTSALGAGLSHIGTGAITPGFASVLAGATGAGAEAIRHPIDTLSNPKQGLEDLLKNYRDYQQNAQKYYQKGSEEHPVASMLGTGAGFVSSFPLIGAAAKGLGIAGKAAPAISEIANSEGKLAAGTELAKRVAVSGAKAFPIGVGIGAANAPTNIIGASDEDKAQAFKHALKSGLIASGIGAGVGAIAETAGPALANTKLGQVFTKSKQLAQENIPVVGDEAVQAAKDEISDQANQMSKQIMASKELGEASAYSEPELASQGKTVDLNDWADQASKEADSLVDGKQKEEILNAINDVVKGKKIEKQIITGFEPVRTVEASPGTAKQLEDEAIKEVEALKSLGVEAKYNIKRSMSPDGRPMLTKVVTTDEPIGAAEKVVQQLSDEGGAETSGPSTKVKASYENSPENKIKAEDKLAKLNAKAQIEGTGKQYELLDDTDQGFYHVVEKTPSAPSVPVGGELGEAGDAQLETNPDQLYKTTAKAKTAFEEPDEYAHTDIQPKEDTIETREGGTPTLDFAKAQDLNQTLSAKMKDRNLSIEERNFIKDQREKLTDLMDEAFPGYRKANENYFRTQEFDRNAAIDYTKPEAIRSTLTKMNTDILAKQKFNTFVDQVKTIDPDLAAKIQQMGPEAAQKFGFIQGVQGSVALPTTAGGAVKQVLLGQLPKNTMARAGEFIGKRRLANGVSPYVTRAGIKTQSVLQPEPQEPSKSMFPSSPSPGNAMEEISSKLYTADNSSLKQVAQRMSGDPILSHYGEALNKAIENNDEQAKNNAIFLILQNPNARKALTPQGK